MSTERSGPWGPVEVSDYARKVFSRAGMAEDEGIRWLNAGFGPLPIEALVGLGVGLVTAVRGRELGLDSSVYRRAVSASLDPAEFVEALGRFAVGAAVGTPASREQLVANLMKAPLERRDHHWRALVGILIPLEPVQVDTMSTLEVTAELEALLKAEGHSVGDMLPHVLSGCSIDDAIWRTLGFDAEATAKWRRAGVAAGEARRRHANHHRPIDVFDGVPEDEQLHRNRARETVSVFDTTLTAARASGRPLPEFAQRFAGEAEAHVTLELLGFRVQFNRLRDRFAGSFTRGALVCLRGDRGQEPIGVIEPNARGVTYRLYGEPDDENRPQAARDIREALERLLDGVARPVDLAITLVDLDASTVVDALNLPNPLPGLGEVVVASTELVSAVDPDGRKWFVPVTSMAGAKELKGAALVLYGNTAVAYPGPIALGELGGVEAPSRAQGSTVVSSGRRGPHSVDVIVDRWKAHTPIAWLSADEVKPVALWRTELGVAWGDRLGPSSQKFDDLRGCIVQLLSDSAGLQLSQDVSLDLVLREDCNELRPTILEALRAGSPGFRPGTEYRQVREPLLYVGADEYGAVPFDDGTFELVRLNEFGYHFYAAIGEVREMETASRTSGLFVRSVGRLADGSVVFVEDLDECEGRVSATREPMSDAQAVDRWLHSINYEPLDYVSLARFIYRDEGEVTVASDFDPSASETLEVDLWIGLSDDELNELFALLEQRQDE